jgi:thimet oligopeptidase
MRQTNTLDVADFARLTPESLERFCREAMESCDAAIAAIVAVPDDERTVANTLLALEEALEPVSLASGAYAFMAYVSADDALRERGRELDQELDKYQVGLSFREVLYAAIRAFAAAPGAAALTGESARLLEHELRDYRRNGFELAAAERARLQALFERLVELGVAFRNAIDDWDDAIMVRRVDLAGLPDSFIDGLATVEQDGETRYRVSLDYPELFPFLSNAKDPSLRRELFEKDQRKGGPENVRLLEEAIRVRHEAATLLGYDSWAAYTIEVRMAKRRESVDSFLTGLRPRLERKREADLAHLRAAKLAETGSGSLDIWDWRYYHTSLMKSAYAIDEFIVAEYFPLATCLEGLFDATQALLGVRFQAAPGAPRWHADVQAFDVYEAGGSAPFARFYMDLFPRPNKYGHAAAFTLRRGRRLRDGSYQQPVSAIVANFTKPGPEQPSLLRHSELETLWHEFGHILHQVLTRAERSRFSGTATERDFVEAPSQMLERWCWEPAVLARFARHYRTGEPIPTELVDRLVAAKQLDSGVTYSRQLYFAALDLAYHSPGFSGDSTAECAALHPLTGFPYTPATHFQGGFGHLFGYDAGYYGYLWSEVFGEDMWTVFEQEGPLNPGTGMRYRKQVLERGGSVDGDVLVRDFLGREPTSDAFLRAIGLEISG